MNASRCTGTRSWHRSVLVMTLLITGIHDSARAECPEPYTVQLRLQFARNSPEPFWAELLTGNVYLDVDCLTEARTHYRSAGLQLNQMSLSDDDEFHLRTLVTASLDLVEALELQRQGDLTAAREKLVAVLAGYEFAALRLPAVFALAELDRQLPHDEKAWKELQETLQALGERGFAKAFGELAQAYSRRGQTQEGLRLLERELAKELEYQQRTQLIIELARLLLETGRLAEAQLLMNSIETEAGRKLIDAQARIAFLELAIQIWEERQRTGGDRTAADRLRVYLDALQQARRILPVSIAAGEIRADRNPWRDCIASWAESRDIAVSQDLKPAIEALLKKIMERKGVDIVPDHHCDFAAVVLDEIRFEITTDAREMSAELEAQIEHLRRELNKPDFAQGATITRIIKSARNVGAGSGRLEILASDFRVNILINGEELGQSNWLQYLPSGEYDLTLARGGLTLESDLEIRINSGDRILIQVRGDYKVDITRNGVKE